MYEINVKTALYMLMFAMALFVIVTTVTLTSLIAERKAHNLDNVAHFIIASNGDQYRTMIVARDIVMGEKLCSLLGGYGNYTSTLDNITAETLGRTTVFGVLSWDSRLVSCYSSEGIWNMRNWWQELLNVSFGPSQEEVQKRINPT